MKEVGNDFLPHGARSWLRGTVLDFISSFVSPGLVFETPGKAPPSHLREDGGAGATPRQGVGLPKWVRQTEMELESWGAQKPEKLWVSLVGSGKEWWVVGCLQPEATFPEGKQITEVWVHKPHSIPPHTPRILGFLVGHCAQACVQMQTPRLMT